VDAVARVPRRDVPLLRDVQAAALHLRRVLELNAPACPTLLVQK
jgi:hypothetical protein